MCRQPPRLSRVAKPSGQRKKARYSKLEALPYSHFLSSTNRLQRVLEIRD
jgi:hypothetical protein